jgi:hypothetical protein
MHYIKELKETMPGNPSTQEAEAGGSWVPGQLGLYKQNLSQTKSKNKKNKKTKETSYIIISVDEERYLIKFSINLW